jgi:DNA-binding NarL/FixJ family response regulator
VIRVLIVDDHPVVRQGLVALLSVKDDMTVAGEAGDGPAAIFQAGSVSPDVVLLDPKLPGMDGVAVLSELAGRHRVLVLTSATDPEWADRSGRTAR